MDDVLVDDTRAVAAGVIEEPNPGYVSVEGEARVRT
jgi:hypothetical protein